MTIPQLSAEKIRLLARIKSREDMESEFKDIISHANSKDLVRIRELEKEICGIEMFHKLQKEAEEELT